MFSAYIRYINPGVYSFIRFHSFCRLLNILFLLDLMKTKLYAVLIENPYHFYASKNVSTGFFSKKTQV